MRIEYRTKDLERLATEKGYTHGLPEGVAKAYRRRIQWIIASPDERSLYAMQGSFDYKKLKGSENERQIRLNDQYRIRLEIVERDGVRVLRILEVGDFHD